MLIVKLVTPLMLATAPVAISLPADIRYDHQAQVSNQTEKLAQFRNPTWNATQTFDFQGRPWDNDND